MVSLRIQADADLPLVQPGMDLMIDLDRQLPECVPFPECLIIHAQNIWCARWTVSNRSTPGISRFVSGVWIQLVALNSPELVPTRQCRVHFSSIGSVLEQLFGQVS